METRNIYYIFVITILSALLLSGCQHPRSVKAPKVEAQPPKEQPAPRRKAPSVQVPEFASRRAPKIGLILGPGGAKALAHIGVLQEFERYKVPIEAIVGLEWGALIGGLYAANGEVHELDWKITKLPKLNVQKKNFFSSQWQPLKKATFAPFLKQVAQGKLQNTKIPFACPFTFTGAKKVKMAKSGSLRKGIQTCWAFPPIFARRSVVAAPYAIAESVDYLIKGGVELIIYVDVLGGVKQQDFKSWPDSWWNWLLWSSVQSITSKSTYYGVNEKINIDTSSYSFVDTDQRLRLIQLGQQEAAGAVEKLSEKYDF